MVEDASFKFKLGSLYRLKIFKEEKISIQLGEIVKKVDIMKKKIKNLNFYLQDEYYHYEKTIAHKTNARYVQLHPSLIDARRIQIKTAEKNLKDLQYQYEQKMKELVKAKGEVKVMEKLKEDAFLKHKRKHNKKEEQDIEDLQQMRFNGVEKYGNF